MRLMFTGIISPWLLLLLFAGMAALTVYLYRKQSLPMPWSRILPGVRIAVLFLLMLMLFQPVLAKFKVNTIRGKIPVIVDTSGSMSLTDNYSPARKIEIAWQMKWYRRKLRNTVFLEQREKLVDLAKMLNEIDINDPKPASKKLKKAANELRDMASEINKSVKGTKYLSGSKGEAYSGNAYKKCDSIITRFGKNLDSVSKSLTDAEKKKDKNRIKVLAKQYNKHIEDGSNLYAMLVGAQKEADMVLSQAGIKAVDKGMKEIESRSRAELARYLLTDSDSNFLEKLGKRGDVEVFSFDEKTSVLTEREYSKLSAELPSTKIGSVLQGVMKYYENQPVAGVVLITDGNSNAGQPVQAVRQGMRERDIPLFSLGVGSTELPDDIAIARVIAPATAFIKDNINVSVVLKRQGFTEQSVKLKIESEGKTIKTHTVKAGGEPTVVVSIPFEEKKGGTRHYTVEAEIQDSEAIKRNNSKAFTISVLEDRIRTLLIDEFPRWESRYASMMLKRDHRVDLNTIFVGSEEEGKLPVERGRYPASRKELFGYHIIILGDVNPVHFTDEQKKDIRDFVVERGGCLITIAGEHYMPARYAGTELEGLIPLRRFKDRRSSVEYAALDDIKRINTLDDGIYKIDVEEFAQYDDMLQIGGTPETSRELWEKLPGMNWVKEGVVASRSADQLVSGYLANKKGQLSPVMIKAYAGVGRVLYLGSDSFWRWRYRARWTYHHRFWGQVLLWSTLDRTTGSDKYVKLMTDRFSYTPDEKIVLKARILDEEGMPIENANASADICEIDKKGEPGKVIKTVPLVSIEGSGGEYRAQVYSIKNGRYKVVPQVEELNDKELKAEVEFQVTDLSTSEYIELALNEGQLKELSDKYLPFERAEDLVKDIKQVSKKEEQREDTELWDTFHMIILICGLLGFEWIMRKKLRLV